MYGTFYRSSMKLLRRQTRWTKRKKTISERRRKKEGGLEDETKEGSRN